MHGTIMTKNVRRTGVPATKRGIPNPEYVRSIFDGPTAERIAKSESHFTIGDDKQGTRVYHFHDSPLDRLYSRLARRSSEETRARREYAALLKYRHHWYSAGLLANLSSVDLNRIYAADASSMSGMAKSERQADHRVQYRLARALIGHRPGIVVDNVVCSETTLEIAGYSVGFGYYKKKEGTFSSPYRAREEATKLLRAAANQLAALWGIN